MKILVGCECSGAVREELRALGHDAYSNDLKPAEDASPFHIQGDVFDAIASRRWDMGVFFPDCTYLCGSGLHWNGRRPGRAELTEQAVDFVRRLMFAPIPRVAIENPIGILSKRLRLPDQIIQPYMFGDDASKKTCLWLVGLPRLFVPHEEKWIAPRMVCRDCAWSSTGPWLQHQRGCPRRMVPRWGNQTDSGQNKLPPSASRAADRARTYPGIARAMASTWGR